MEVSDLSNVSEGAFVLRRLIDAGIDVSGAAWMKLEGAGWWFLVVSKTADEVGTSEAARKVFEVLDRLQVPRGRRGLIIVVRTDNPTGRDILRMKESRRQNGYLGFTGVVGGHEATDIYVYSDDDLQPWPLGRIGGPEPEYVRPYGY